ncbi:PR domain zinc finger protein 2 [Scleropages formosus]|uniref:PR domain zinc finger protein 2 n=1 Tax=Scleropages formosus TaxID=113540 RepID=UPI0010FA758C|nr:PR domain zinc finger protein 2-like [Scleropages formosus]XP_018592110.2 PR domain zinc finger protein 2-like [Scleropages formosus]XP_018592111.2 PR domain zinc finger protein 2-like [Scleropages formosus]XP_018592112.2 PR domain zinc finger protein 2-like [Scleropages formosus]
MSQGCYEEQKELCAGVPEDSLQLCAAVTVKEEGKNGEPEEGQFCLPPQQNTSSVMEVGFGETDIEPSDGMSSFKKLKEEDAESFVPGVVSASYQPHPGVDQDHSPEEELQESASFSCEHCERRFSTKQGLERHTHIHATANRCTYTFKCRYCNKPFGSQVGRRRHERRHENASVKKAGLVSVPTALLGLPSDSSGPDPAATSANLVISALPKGVEPKVASPDQKQGVTALERQEPAVAENGQPKELHPCKYCKKVFGTHTNMRRHQRRIHERHLLPKGVRRNGILQEAQLQKPSPPGQSPSASPPPVYVVSGDAEDEVAQEEYMVDISSNISENLSLYIDGKILSTSAVSNCEVIQVDSGSATLFGLDAFIINPEQISQALKVDTAACTVKEVPNHPVSKRRTATPPLLPSIKTELESGSFLSSLSSTSSASSSSSSIVGTVLSQPIETLALQKEKTIYLSPKLKQLLQTQESHKPTVTIITEGHRPGPPPPITVLSSASGRFKRRTASPPSSPQHSPSNCTKSEAGVSHAAKVPKLESHCTSPSWSLSGKDDRDVTSPSETDSFRLSVVDWPSLRTGGNSCNQQPLDLSSAVSKRDDELNKGPEEVVLDLSMNRKSSADLEMKGNLTTQTLMKKKKPDTSVLEKVLLNEYDGLEVTGERNSGVLGTSSSPAGVGITTSSLPDTQSHNAEELLPGQVTTPLSLHPPPPSLTPVTMQPPFSSGPDTRSPTPPPPVLPTVPSPQLLSQFSELLPPYSPTQTSLPVLSPKASPRPLEITEGKHSPSSEHDSHVMVPDVVNCVNLYQLSEPLNSSSELKNNILFTNQSVNQTGNTSSECAFIGGSSSAALSNCSITSFNITHRAVFIECTLSIESSPNLITAPVAIPVNIVKSPINNIAVEQETRLEEQQKPLPQSLEPPVLLASLPESVTASSQSAVISERPSSSVMPPPSALSLTSTGFEDVPASKEPEEKSADPAGVSLLTTPSASDDKSEAVEPLQQQTFSKSFMCNVCEKPFCSIKELSGHILEHAEGWPFKCEFCVLLFENADSLLEHRSSLHGVGKIYICSTCSKEFAFLCNVQQHQKDLHPGQNCTYTEVENGKLRPQNYNGPTRQNTDSSSALQPSVEGSLSEVKEEEIDDSTEELYTIIKIMASEGGKPKGPNVRLGINQHYPSFKPPPFPYHNRTPAGSVASATNFTTHNIPQTFTTAIRCTKCGKSFDNMPELHKHIFVCANASDKKRYTPKKNPVPLKQFAKTQNGSFSPVEAAAASSTGQNGVRRIGQPKKLHFSKFSSKVKVNVLKQRKNQLVQKAISHKNKTVSTIKRSSALPKEDQETHVCPHCSREFTYPGSLKKHVTVSCPMKPVPKKSRKRGGIRLALAHDHIGNLRRRTADSEIKQQGRNIMQTTIGKTRARSFGPASSIASSSKPRVSKNKMATRANRPASFPAGSVPFSKKSKTITKGNGSVPQHSRAPSPALPPVASASKLKSIAKEVTSKNAAHQNPLLKKEERGPVSIRMRSGGPVTRSLQQASGKNPSEVAGEAETSEDLRESQDPQIKMVE